MESEEPVAALYVAVSPEPSKLSLSSAFPAFDAVPPSAVMVKVASLPVSLAPSLIVISDPSSVLKTIELVAGSFVTVNGLSARADFNES